jgi:hypothetical protein
VTPSEERELRVLVDQAMDLRDSPYFVDAVQAIVDWHESTHVRAYWREREELWAARVLMVALEKGRARAVWAA